MSFEIPASMLSSPAIAPASSTTSGFGTPNMAVEHVPEHHGRSGLIKSIGERAVFIYFFEGVPNQFLDQAIRPYHYNIDDRTASVTGDMVQMVMAAKIPVDAAVKNISNTVNLSGAIMPSTDMRMQFQASQLSDNYRFLMITSEQVGKPIGNAGGPGTRIRRIYTGVVMGGEPVSKTLFLAGRHSDAINPNAGLLITQKTVLSNRVSYNGLGVSGDQVSVRESNSYYHGTLAKNMTVHSANDLSSRVASLMPNNVLAGVELDIENGQYLASPSYELDASTDVAATTISNKFHGGKLHMENLIGGAINGNVENQRTSMGSFGVDSYSRNYEQSANIAPLECFRHALTQHTAPSTLSELDFDEHQLVNLRQLDQKFGNDLEMTIDRLNRPMYYGTADQTQNGIINQLSTMLIHMVSTVMTDYGLGDMRFDYRAMKDPVFGNMVPSWNIQHSAPFWPTATETEVLMRTDAAKSVLESTVFKMIFDSYHDFYVSMRVDTTGHSACRLSLVEQGMISEVDFEIPTALGGLVSPMMADSPAFAYNGGRLIEFWDAVSPDANQISNNPDIVTANAARAAVPESNFRDGLRTGWNI
jgi:hypothetical protein